MEAKPKKKDLLTYVNNFITNLNKKILSIPKASQQRACNILLAILDKNIALIRQYSLEGLPNELPILRAFIWKILLKYLPDEPKKWEETLISKRAQYNSYKKFVEGRLKIELETKKYNSKDILEQIIKDVYRTNTNNPFFYESINKDDNIPKEELLELYKKRKSYTFNDINEIYYPPEKNEIHAEVLKRILFIYTFINQDISYHQGMNELLAPIFYCFSYDKTYEEETEENIEADTYWCFHYLMSKVSLSFVSAREKGLDAKSYIFEKCLEFVDEDIFNKLKVLNIRGEYYCYRWFILLFSQDFDIDKILILWDVIFTKEDIYYFVVYLGIAIMEIKKDIIIKGEMSDIMQALQSIGDVDINELIQKTKEINEKYKNDLDLFILNTKQVNSGKDN